MRVYTPAEKRKRAWLLLRTSKQAVADAVDPRLERQIDRIDQQAEDRGRREGAALAQLLETAKQQLATARAEERAASRPDKTTARQTRQKAERRLREVESAVRKFHR